MTTPAPDSEPIAAAPADTSGDKDRLSNWQIAVFSGLLGLVGAVIGGFFSYLVALHESDSQASEARQDFLRQQQQTAYAKLIGDAQSKHSYYLDCYAGLNTLQKTVDTNFVLSTRKANDDISQMIAVDASSLALVGSFDAYKYSQVLAADFDSMATSCTALATVQYNKLPRGAVTPSVLKQFKAELSHSIANTDKDLQNLIDAGRRDLQLR